MYHFADIPPSRFVGGIDTRKCDAAVLVSVHLNRWKQCPNKRQKGRAYCAQHGQEKAGSNGPAVSEDGR
jgi:hypothetical protein